MTTSTVTNKIIDTANFKHLAIAEDAVDHVQFTIPKTYDGNDLSAGTVYSLWTIPGGSGDMTELTTTVSGDNLLSVWPLSGAVVSKKGMVEFQLVILVGTTIVWKSFTAHFYVDRKLNPTDLDFTADVLTAHLASVIAARDRAETAADTAEGVLEDAEFQIVADDLALDTTSNIKLVAGAKANVDIVAGIADEVATVAGGIADIDKVEDIAADITAVALIDDDVSAVALITDDVTAVAADSTDIGVVATDLALGASSNIKLVAAIDSDVTAVAAVDDAVSALAAKTTEIDALYAEIDAIAAKVSITKMPTGTAVYSQDAWATTDGWVADSGALSVVATVGSLRFTANSAYMFIRNTAVGAVAGGQKIKIRYRASKNNFVFDIRTSSYGIVLATPTPATVDYQVSVMQIPLSVISSLQFYAGGLTSGDWLEFDFMFLGDYSYTDNTLATEASRIANQLGDTAGVGTKASATITATDIPTATKGDTIGGKKYTFVSALTASPGVEGEVLIEATKEDTLENLKLALDETARTNNGTKYWAAAVHPLVSATRASAIVTLTARMAGILGSQIALVCESGTNHTASSSTLTGGTDDVGAKISTQMIAMNGLWTIPTFANSWVAFDATRTAKYSKDSVGTVRIKGIVKSGTVTAAMFTLPAGFRPAEERVFPIASNGAFGIVTITAAGVVTCTVGNNTYVSLDGINFKAEA